MTDTATSSPILLHECTVKFSPDFSLRAISWRINPGECWAILGANGSGKSALGAALNAEGEQLGGSMTGLPEASRVAIVSLEQQAQLIRAERDKDDSDISDEVFAGTSLREMLEEVSTDSPLRAQLLAEFDLERLLDRGFRQLSTGETRKFMLLQALISEPQLLILDEPFEGLDDVATQMLGRCLAFHATTISMVLILNRFEEIPTFATHLGLMVSGELQHQISASDTTAVAQLAQLLHLQTTDLQVPEPDPDYSQQPPRLDSAQPLVNIRQGRIAYGEQLVFENIDWRIEAGQHWQLAGPNGSGKTCLLNLITGDHPQCYSNDIFVFGYQRGQGESIWDIKQYIGYVSSALQWEYRVSVSVVNVVLSGFFDSIGVYQAVSASQLAIANRWLDLLGMADRADSPFQALSFGDQRLLLIARAMVKHPTLLILDEPCLGLDDMNRQRVLALIARVCAQSRTTVIYVNHHVSDRILGIDNVLTLG
jgi:molybdate transport system ATP-binding protein